MIICIVIVVRIIFIRCCVMVVMCGDRQWLISGVDSSDMVSSMRNVVSLSVNVSFCLVEIVLCLSMIIVVIVLGLISNGIVSGQIVMFLVVVGLVFLLLFGVCWWFGVLCSIDSVISSISSLFVRWKLLIVRLNVCRIVLFVMVDMMQLIVMLIVVVSVILWCMLFVVFLVSDRNIGMFVIGFMIVNSVVNILMEKVRLKVIGLFLFCVVCDMFMLVCF